MSKAVNTKWKKTFPDTIGNQNRPSTGVDDTQPFETGAFPQYMANDPVRYDLQNAAMSQSMSNDARLKEMVDARGKELDDHKVDPGAHKTGIAGNAATATKVVTNAANGASANIAEATMGGSDFARIRVSGANDASELAIETADNGDEPIVARQYTGVFGTVARTASILDTNGNTSFPGTVVAPKFTGTLNGNAATASKLASPRTISLTGKAAGSTTFDGSANAAINVTSVNADTASKLSTARKINITGNATGAANFDGSGDISINTNVNYSTTSARVIGYYTGNGGQQGPGYFGKERAGCLMSNAIVRGHSEYKNWLYMDNYSGTDVGGATAIGVSRQEMRAYIMRSNADRATWNDSAELLSSANYNEFAPTKTGGGASGTWPISISGTAEKANGLTGNLVFPDISNVATSNKISWNGSTDGADIYYQTTESDQGNLVLNLRDDPNCYLRIACNGAFKSYFSPDDGNFHGNVNGNADSATNADKLDGYHASDLLSKIYPVGSIYMSMSATNPHDLFGVGTWKRISQGRMLLGADDSTYKAGATGGEATHTLTAEEMPAHSHGISTSGNHSHYFYGSDNNNGPLTEGDGLDTEGNGHFSHNVRFTTSSAGAHTHTISNSGGGAAHNNMSPYLVCYIWQRTA